MAVGMNDELETLFYGHPLGTGTLQAWLSMLGGMARKTDGKSEPGIMRRHEEKDPRYTSWRQSADKIYQNFALNPGAAAYIDNGSLRGDAPPLKTGSLPVREANVDPEIAEFYRNNQIPQPRP